MLNNKLLKEHTLCETLTQIRNRTQYLLRTSSWNSIELKAKVVNKQNYSTYNKLHKQFYSTDLLTAFSIVTGCRVMVDSVQFWYFINCNMKLKNWAAYMYSINKNL